MFREFELKSTLSGLLMSHREKISSMLRFQTVGLKTVLLKLCVSPYAAMKMLERKLLLVLIAVPWFFLLIVLSIKLERTERTFRPKQETGVSFSPLSFQ